MPRVIAHRGDPFLEPNLEPFLAVAQQQDGSGQASTVKTGGFAVVDRVKALVNGSSHAKFRLAYAASEVTFTDSIHLNWLVESLCKVF